RNSAVPSIHGSVACWRSTRRIRPTVVLISTPSLRNSRLARSPIHCGRGTSLATLGAADWACRPAISSATGRIPVMTYFELQFIKAEAALRMGDQATALAAYKTGIQSHFQFVNDRSTEAGNPASITTATRDSFLASPNIVPATLTLSHVMSQKY